MKRFLVSTSVICGLTLSGLAMAKAPASTPELLKKGEDSYKTNCVTCHGEKGDGMGPAGQYMSPKPRNFAKDHFKNGTKPEQIFKTISKGLDGTAMTAFGNLPEEERWGLAYYVEHFRGADAAAPAKMTKTSKKSKKKHH